MKKTLSLLLSFMLMISTISTYSINVCADEFESSGQCGRYLSYTFDYDTGLLTISGTGSMTNYGYQESPFYGVSSIKDVVVENGVTNIGDYSFEECEELNSITLPSSITYIGNNAFSNCYSIKKVCISDMAKWCAITFDDNPVRNAHNLYLNNKLVTQLTVPEDVKSISDFAFEHCTCLESVTLPDSVKKIGNSAFEDCINLTSVTFSGDVSEVGLYAFKNCDSLNAVYIDDIAKWCGISFSGEYANPLSYAHHLYLNNELLTELMVPDTVNAIGNAAFTNCTDLTNVIIPDSVTAIGTNAFSNCKNIAELKMPCSVKIGEYGFYGCSRIEKVTLSKGNGTMTSFNSSYRDDPFYTSKSNLNEIVLENGIKSICDNAFYDCTRLTKVTIPDSLVSVGKDAFYNTGCYNDDESWDNGVFYVDSHLISANKSSLSEYNIRPDTKVICDSAFYNCSNLKKVTIPKTVTAIGYATFAECSSLKSAPLPSTLKKISKKSFYSTGLESITIPDSVTTIGEEAFAFTYSLSNLTVGKNVSSIGTSAFRSSGVKKVILPNKLKTVNAYAFYNCKNLKSVTFGSGVTKVGKYAFSGCTSLTSLKLNDSLTTIGDYAFSSTKITSVIIPKRLKSIGNYTFAYSSINTALLPYSVKKINVNRLFSSCYYLSTVYYTGSKADFKKTAPSFDSVYFSPKIVYMRPEVWCFRYRDSKRTVMVECDTVSGVNGYQVQYSTNTNFKGAKNRYIKRGGKYKTSKIGKSYTYTVFNNLKSKKRYYFRMRTYKKIGGKIIYSKWSKKRSIKTK